MNFDKLIDNILESITNTIPILDGQEEIYRTALFHRDRSTTVLPPRRLTQQLFRDSKPHYRGNDALQALDVVDKLLVKAETNTEKAELFRNNIKQLLHVVGEWSVEGSTIQRDYYTIDVFVLVDQDYYRTQGIQDAVASKLDKSVDISDW